jgi:hypothetical protein
MGARTNCIATSSRGASLETSNRHRRRATWRERFSPPPFAFLAGIGTGRSFLMDIIARYFTDATMRQWTEAAERIVGARCARLFTCRNIPGEHSAACPLATAYTPLGPSEDTGKDRR